MHVVTSSQKSLVELQEDLAFDKLDEVLDTAQWQRGVVIINHGNRVVYCYDMEMLERELAIIAVEAVRAQYNNCNINAGFLVTNILDEYSKELYKAQIFRRNRRKFKKAQ